MLDQMGLRRVCFENSNETGPPRPPHWKQDRGQLLEVIDNWRRISRRGGRGFQLTFVALEGTSFQLAVWRYLQRPRIHMENDLLGQLAPAHWQTQGVLPFGVGRTVRLHIPIIITMPISLSLRDGSLTGFGGLDLQSRKKCWLSKAENELA